jgi:hypothetical protein
LDSVAQSGELKTSKKTDFREMPQMVGFIYWWLLFVPTEIFTISVRTVKKTFHFFSIDLLLKTLLQPWKKDEIDTTNMALDDKARVWMMNLVSRLVGAIVRGGTIAIGLGAIAGIVLIATVLLVGFILLPFIAIWLIIQGFNFSSF